jgi:hypothetical protein
VSRRVAAAALAAGALVVAGAGCVPREAGAAGAFRAVEVTGRVTVRSPDAARPRVLRAGERVPVGSQVRTAAGASVRLAGPGGAFLLGGDGAAAPLGPGRVALEVGRALAEAGGVLVVESRGVTIRAEDGVTRVERELGTLAVGVYAGRAQVELVGRRVSVPALRELLVTGGIPLDRAPAPLSLSAADPWDRMLLGDVLDFDAELAQFGRGFANTFGAAAREPGFYAAFVPVGDLGFLRGALGALEPADVLVGLVFSFQLSARAGEVSAVPRFFVELLALREAGATWGLIARERGLDLRALLQAVVEAIRRGTTPPAPTAGGGASTGTTGRGASPAPRPTASGSPTPPPTPSPSPSPRPSPRPSPSPSPSPCRLLDRLLGTCGDRAGGGSGSGSGGSGSGGCSLLGALLRPDC